jgi:hypothetical protein
MPDWPELATILASHAKTPDGTTPLAVAQRYEEKFGRVQLIETIRDSLHLDKSRPGLAHKSFVRLPFDTIYTTNFDLLLEEAYSEETRPFRSLVGELQLPFHAGQAASTIIKMHGDLRHEEHIVVTRNDYDTFLEKYPVIATHLSAMLITRTPLFIGYSLTDPDFGNIRRVVRSRLGAFERMAYVIQFDVSNEKVEEALRDHLHVISLDTSPGSSRDHLLAGFFQQIQDTLDTKEAVNLRSTRPDVFEEIRTDVIKEAVRSPDHSPVVEASSRLCFVLMPFGERFDLLYRNAIAPAVKDQGFTPLRADELTGTGFVMEQIRAAIQQARFCIADLTTANPNVLYEIGLAHAAAKPTIFIAEKGSRLPFDLAARRVMFYEDSAEGHGIANSLRDAISLSVSQDRMPEAARLLDMGLHRASIAVSAIALEQRLNSMIRKFRPGTSLQKPSLNRLLGALAGLNAITETDLTRLSEVVALRNRAVHGPDEPTKLEAQFVLNTVRTFFEQDSLDGPTS